MLPIAHKFLFQLKRSGLFFCIGKGHCQLNTHPIQERNTWGGNLLIPLVQVVNRKLGLLCRVPEQRVCLLADTPLLHCRLLLGDLAADAHTAGNLPQGEIVCLTPCSHVIKCAGKLQWKG
jgi:hypothetical protein